ncbi:MAG: Uncharacterized protein FD143_2596 [Ignavibacteria bacterium]|nr:MAG: Uncharacterized protein FD143_2596 [Ignavibacteria bacterium]KAF0160368.1 MAG: Uncharacterized protein FD188_1746 [Ignavibacteria bacterium]
MFNIRNKVHHNIELILVLIIVLLFSRGFIWINVLYFLFPLLLGILIVTDIQSLKQELLKYYEIIIYFPFVAVILLSALWSQHIVVTLTRSFYFLFLLFGMYIFSLKMEDFNLSIKKLFIPIITLVIIVSVLSLLLKFPTEYRTGGNGLGFMGFAAHQNTLGSIMFVFTSILNYTLFSLNKNESARGSKIYLLLLANLLSLFILISTFSRGAIISYFLFGVVFVLFEYGYKKTLLVIVSIAVVFLLLSRIDMVNQYLNYAGYKGADRIISSREAMYLGSFEAAKNGGLFGLGYGVSDQAISVGVPGDVVNGVFIREKGSTLLALVEETGIIGAILFYLPVGIVLWKGVRVKTLRQDQCYVHFVKLSVTNGMSVERSKELSFLIGIIIAMTVHSQIEAWGVGVGSVMLPVYLLFLARLSRKVKCMSY